MAGIQGCEFCGDASPGGLYWLWSRGGYPCCVQVCCAAQEVREALMRLTPDHCAKLRSTFEKFLIGQMAETVSRDMEEMFIAQAKGKNPKSM